MKTAIVVIAILAVAGISYAINPVETVVGVKITHPNDPNPLDDVVLVTQFSSGAENQWRCAPGGVPGQVCWALGTEAPGARIEVTGLGSIVWPDVAASITLLP